MTLLEPCRNASPVLETKRLVLRAPCPQDAAAVAHLINDRRIAENTARIPHPYSVADAETFLAGVNRGDGEIALLITLPSGELIGGCGIGFLSDPDPEIGYWIGLPYWRHGYATEAAHALIDHAFGTLGYPRLVSGARVSNPASRRVLEKCGFQWTGVVLTRVKALGSSVPVDRFLLDRGLWAALKTWGSVHLKDSSAPS
jgi:RimJ/RimL family protein N-acetyltransferase